LWLRLFDLALIAMEIEGDAAASLMQPLLARPSPSSMEVMSSFPDFSYFFFLLLHSLCSPLLQSSLAQLR
jgi:hypothetical protein